MLTASEAVEPPAHFADRVMAALPKGQPSRSETEMWGAGWGLVPAFVAMMALFVFLYQYEAQGIPVPTSLLPMDELSSSEKLILETSAPDQDAISAAVLEGDQI